MAENNDINNKKDPLEELDDDFDDFNEEFDLDEDISDNTKSDKKSSNLPLQDQPSYGEELDLEENSNKTKPDIDEGFSKVAFGKQGSIVFLAVLGLIVIGLIYYLVFANHQKEEVEKHVTEVSDKIKTVTPPESNVNDIIEPKIPSLPESPRLITPSAPSAPNLPNAPSLEEKLAPPPPAENVKNSSSNIVPPPLGAKGNAPNFANSKEQKDKQNADARRKSTIALKATTGTSKTSVQDAGDSGPADLPPPTGQVTANYIGDLSSIVAQGKIIDAVLETAINTELSGALRAIVSRDVYSEQGRNILIPKGSRLLGIYASSVKVGQTRIQVTWNRVMRPDGISIDLGSIGTDSLGRAGVTGDVDNKYLEAYTNAILTSLINITLGWAQDRVQEQQTGSSSSTTTTVTNSSGDTTSTSTSTNLNDAIGTAADDIASVSETVVQNSLSTTPSISVDQGTRIKVFVQKDLVFPSHISSSVTVVQ